MTSVKPKKGTNLSLTIEKMAFGGMGLASHEGFKIFVPRALPGDQVLVQIGKVRKNYAEGHVVEMEKESPDRIEARCEHAARCGGCTMQNLPYEKQLAIKTEQVREIMKHLAGYENLEVAPALGCEEIWYTRNKMELSFAHDSEGLLDLGFHPPGYHYEVIKLNHCYLQSPEMPELAKKVLNWARELELPAYHAKKNEGLLRSLTIREGKRTGQRMLMLWTSAGFEDSASLQALFAEDPEVSDLILVEVFQAKGQKTRYERRTLKGRAFYEETLYRKDGSALSFDVDALAFFQTNTRQAERLYNLVEELAGLSGKEEILDLYSGTGTISLFLASQCARVDAVEWNPDAVASAQKNAEKNKISNVFFHAGRVEDQLANFQGQKDFILVDPPRNGLGPQVVQTLADFQAPNILYISCNPTTLARDLKEFRSLGYECDKVHPVDMFPHTAHVECVVLLSKRSTV